MNIPPSSLKPTLPYVVINAPEKFSGIAGPGKKFIYLIFKNQTTTNKTQYLGEPLYIGKTHNIPTRLKNHAIIKQQLRENPNSTLYVYIAGSIDSEYSDRAEADLKTRLKTEGYLPSTEELKTVRVEQLITSWQKKWSTVTKDAKKYQTLIARQTPITHKDVVDFFKDKKFSNSATTAINRELVKNYDETTKESVIHLRVGELSPQRIRSLFKELRYWVKVKTSENRYHLSTQTVNKIYAMKASKVRLPLNENELKTQLNNLQYKVVTSTSKQVKKQHKVTIPVPKLLKQPAPRKTSSSKRFTRQELRNFFISNPKINNSTMKVLNEVINTYDPRTGMFTKTLSEKETQVLSSDELKKVFRVEAGIVQLLLVKESE